MMAHVAAPVRDQGAVLTKAVRAAAERLGIRNRDLAVILGASEASISRLRGGRTVRPESREGELSALFIRLYRSLDALVGGDDEKARRWFHADNRHLGDVPATRVRSIEGLVDVVHYLDAMRGKL